MPRARKTVTRAAIRLALGRGRKCYPGMLIKSGCLAPRAVQKNRLGHDGLNENEHGTDPLP